MTGPQLAAVDDHGERPPHLDFVVDERLADAAAEEPTERLRRHPDHRGEVALLRAVGDVAVQALQHARQMSPGAVTPGHEVAAGDLRAAVEEVHAG